MEFTRTIRRYMSGDDVALVKNRLVKLGYLKTALQPRFGNESYQAVRAFQSANNLEVDGIVGKYTWGALFGSDSSTNTPVSAVEIPDWYTDTARSNIGIALAQTTEERRALCLEALNWAIDPEKPTQDPKCFYIRGGNLYDKDLSLHKMTASRLISYFNKPAYAPYYDSGRKEMMLEASKRNDYSIPGCDCSGLIVGLWRKLKIQSSGFDTTANGLYGSYCVNTSDPKPADLAWRNGHIGMFVSPDYVIENIGGAYGAQLTKRTKRRAYNFVDNKLHTFSAWSAYGDPKKY